MSTARINGISINYNVVGEGDPLLLIMGYGMPGDAWLGSIPFLQGFKAIYFDNRGTGLSDKPDGPYSISQMANDAAGLLDHLGIERAHVYGVSMGGMIAQELVLRHSNKVRSLVLGCTMCGGEHATLGEPQVIEALIDLIKDMGKGDTGAWVDRQLPLIFPPAFVEANPGLRDVMTMMVPLLPPTPPETAQYAMEGVFAWTSWDRLTQIKTPTLIVHGDQDILIPVANAHILAGRIRGAQVCIVPGAGHGYAAQDPVGIHEIVTDFLRAH